MKEFAKYIGVIVMLIGVAFFGSALFNGHNHQYKLNHRVGIGCRGIVGLHLREQHEKTEASSVTSFGQVFLLIIPFVIFYFSKKAAYTEDELMAYN